FGCCRFRMPVTSIVYYTDVVRKGATQKKRPDPPKQAGATQAAGQLQTPLVPVVGVIGEREGEQHDRCRGERPLPSLSPGNGRPIAQGVLTLLQDAPLGVDVGEHALL